MVFFIKLSFIGNRRKLGVAGSSPAGSVFTMVVINIERAVITAIFNGVPNNVIGGILSDDMSVAHLTINSFMYERTRGYYEVAAVGLLYENSFDGKSDSSMKARILDRMLELSKKR